MSPKILAVIPTLVDDPADTIKSLLRQTVKVSKILVAVGSWELYKKLTSTDSSVAEYVKPNFQGLLEKELPPHLHAQTILGDYAVFMTKRNSKSIVEAVQKDFNIKTKCCLQKLRLLVLRGVGLLNNDWKS